MHFENSQNSSKNTCTKRVQNPLINWQQDPTTLLKKHLHCTVQYKLHAGAYSYNLCSPNFTIWVHAFGSGPCSRMYLSWTYHFFSMNELELSDQILNAQKTWIVLRTVIVTMIFHIEHFAWLVFCHPASAPPQQSKKLGRSQNPVKLNFYITHVKDLWSSQEF